MKEDSDQPVKEQKLLPWLKEQYNKRLHFQKNWNYSLQTMRDYNLEKAGVYDKLIQRNDVVRDANSFDNRIDAVELELASAKDMGIRIPKPGIFLAGL